MAHEGRFFFAPAVETHEFLHVVDVQLHTNDRARTMKTQAARKGHASKPFENADIRHWGKRVLPRENLHNGTRKFWSLQLVGDSQYPRRYLIIFSARLPSSVADTGAFSACSSNSAGNAKSNCASASAYAM